MAITALTGLLGLVIGSFFSVLVARLDRKEGILAGRSECPSCGHTLAWHDLVPLASYLLLRAKCRYCRQPISAHYPLMEALTAVVLILFVAFRGIPQTPQDILATVGLLLFLALGLFDFFHYILPDKLVFPLMLLALFRCLVWAEPGLVSGVLSGLLLSGAFGILYVVSSGQWLGFGDVKFVLAIGLFFGFPIAIFVVMVAVWLGALAGIVLMGLSRASMKSALPFGTFLSAASLAAIIFSDIFISFANYL